MWKGFREWQTMKIWIKESVWLSCSCVSQALACSIRRLSSHQPSQTLLLVLVGAPTALAVALALRVNLQMSRQLKAIARLFEQIGMGDYATRAAVLAEG